MDIGLLITLVERFPNLYDKRRKDFKNRTIKEDHWHEIATALGDNVDNVQRVWKNVREKYVREKKGLPSGSQYEPNWEFFRLLQFLDDHITPRQTHSAMSITKQASRSISTCSLISGRPSSSSSSVSDPTCSYSIAVMSPEPEDVQNTQHEEMLPATSQQRTPSRFADRSGTPGRKIRNCNNIESIIQTAKDLESTMRNKKQNKHTAFGQYVALTLEDIGETKAKRLKKAIVNLIEAFDSDE